MRFETRMGDTTKHGCNVFPMANGYVAGHKAVKFYSHPSHSIIPNNILLIGPLSLVPVFSFLKCLRSRNFRSSRSWFLVYCAHPVTSLPLPYHLLYYISSSLLYGRILSIIYGCCCFEQ